MILESEDLPVIKYCVTTRAWSVQKSRYLNDLKKICALFCVAGSCLCGHCPCEQELLRVRLTAHIDRNSFHSKEKQEEKVKMESKKLNRKIIIGAAALILLIAVFLIIFNVFREKPVQGSKSITLEVLNQEKQTSTYQVQTDAEFLRQAMEETKGFRFDGEEGDYGFTLFTINGETHDWNVDGSYWAVYVNGEYGQYSIDNQPVKDGDVFRFEYTPPYSE